MRHLGKWLGIIIAVVLAAESFQVPSFAVETIVPIVPAMGIEQGISAGAGSTEVSEEAGTVNEFAEETVEEDFSNSSSTESAAGEISPVTEFVEESIDEDASNDASLQEAAEETIDDPSLEDTADGSTTSEVSAPEDTVEENIDSPFLEDTADGSTTSEVSAPEDTVEENIDDDSLENTADDTTVDDTSPEEIPESAAGDASLEETPEDVPADVDLSESTDAADAGDVSYDESAVIVDGADTADTNSITAEESGTSETAVSEAQGTVSSDSDMIVFNGHIYQRFEEAKSWNTAKAYCESLGGHLVTITSQEEQDFVADLVSSGSKKQYWLGANSLSGKFEWVTGEAFSYSNWSPYEPNHCSGEYYAQMYLEPNPVSSSSAPFEWNDIREDNTFYSGETNFFRLEYTGFLCEWDSLSGKYYLDYSDTSGKAVLIGDSGWLQAYVKSTDPSVDVAEEIPRITWSLEDPSLGTVSVSSYYGAVVSIILKGLLPGETNLVATFSDGSTFSKKVTFEPEMTVTYGPRYENGSIEEPYRLISYSNVWCSVSLEGCGANSDYLNTFINQVTFDVESCKDAFEVIDDSTEVSEDGLTAYKKLRIVGTSDVVRSPKLVFTSPGGNTAETTISRIQKDLKTSLTYSAHGSRWEAEDGEHKNDGTHTFFFTDDYFYRSSGEYHNDLAVMSLGLEISSWSSHDYDDEFASTLDSYRNVGRQKNLNEAFREIGFEDHAFFKYDAPLTDFSNYAAFGIAKKTISNKTQDDTLIAVAIRGGGYGAEWSSNFDLSDSGDSLGFRTAADYAAVELKTYIENLKTSGEYTGNIKIWLVGYSRGAAIANILGHKINSGEAGIDVDAADTYVYTFATPNGQYGNDHSDTNIFNIINDSDIVPWIPLKPGWGFSKYGTTKVLRGCNTSTAVRKSFKNYTGDSLIVYDAASPIKDVVSWMEDLIPDRASYVSMVQDTLMYEFKIINSDQESKIDLILSVLGGIVNSSEVIDKVFNSNSQIVEEWEKGNYIKALNLASASINPAYREKKGFINKTKALYTIIKDRNLISLPNAHYQEHYLAWLESGGIRAMGDDTYAGLGKTERQEIENAIINQFNNDIAKRLEICCPVDVTVYSSNGKVVGEITDNAVVTEEIPCYVDGDTKILYFPVGDNYHIKLTGTDYGKMDYTVKEYSEDCALMRTVKFVDVDLTPGIVYEADVSDNRCDAEETYALSDGQTVTVPALDTERGILDPLYSLTVVGGFADSHYVMSGEEITLSADTPEGDTFAKWLADDPSDVLIEDPYSAETSVRISSRDTTVTAHFAKDHQWEEDYTVDVEPTLKEAGSRSIHCSVCGEIKDGSQVEIPSYESRGIVEYGICGENLTWTLDKNGVLTVSGEGEMFDYGYSQDNKAPWSSNQIKSIVLEKGVTGIGDYAFSLCSNLSDVSIPDSVKSIGKDSFSFCSSLKSVIIPDEVNSIGEYAFNSCSGLASVTISSGCTSIGASAFSSCTSLEEITVPGSVETIETSVFNGCSSLKDLTVSEGVKSIGLNAFEKCVSLENINLPGSLQEIGWSAFGNCTSIKNMTIPEGVQNINYKAFYGCTALESVSIPSTVTILSQQVFKDCTGLKEVTAVQESKTFSSIDGVLYDKGCTRLICYPEGKAGAFCLPESVTSIEISALAGCAGLTEITVEAGNNSFSAADGVLFDKKGSSLICCPAGKEGNYSIPERVEKIQYYAFSGCRDLTEITIPDSVKTISMYAFEKCSGLTKLSFPGSLTSIGNGVFSSCSSLDCVVLRKGLTSIGQYLFNDCGSLSAVYFAGTQEDWNSITFVNSNDDFPGDKLVFVDNVNSLKYAKVTGLTASEYTGNPITQKLLVTQMGTVLEEGKDYTVKWSDNTNAGTAAVTVTGTGTYVDSTTSSFVIKPISIAGSSVTGMKSQTYSGKARTQTPTVKLNGVTLISGTDYTLSYKNNMNAGTATLTIKGTGNYSGSIVINFTIAKAVQTLTLKAGASAIAVGKTTTVSVGGAKGTKTFKSSNTSVASVTSSGKVTAKKVGTVRITLTSAATSNYKAASKYVTIKVLPAATKKITAANLVTGIRITWQKVPGANGYILYRSGTRIAAINSGSTVSYTDKKAYTNGTKYTYKLVAKASTGTSTLSRSLSVFRVSRPAVKTLVNNSAKSMTVKWGKNAKATGYQIQYSRSKTFASGNKTITISKAATVSKVIGKLTKGSIYYVRIRSYRTSGSITSRSAWSPARSVKINK